jgi:hypothetical protein
VEIPLAGDPVQAYSFIFHTLFSGASMKAIAFASAAITIVCSTHAWSADSVLGMGMAHPPKAAELVDRRIYRISFKCSRGASLTGSIPAKALIRTNESNTHLVVIADSVPTRDAADKLKLPENAVALLPVFMVRKGIPDPDNRSACPNDTYVYGGRKLYLMGVASFSTTHEPGIFMSIGYGIAGLIPPLWSMFKGNIPADVSAKVTNYSATEDPLKKTLSALNDDENYSVTEEMGPGKYRVDTAFSHVDIQVSYIRSVLREGGPKVQNAFRKQLDSAPEKLTTTDIKGTCAKLANALAKLGFSKEEDIPYALAYRGVDAGFTADQASQCLGPDFALRAAKMKDAWVDALSWQVLSEKQAAADYPPQGASPDYQAAYSVNKRFTEKFNRALGRIMGTATPAADDQTALNKLLASPFSLQDETAAKAFQGAGPVTSGETLVQALAKTGYRRFGCHQETELGMADDGGKTLLFAFKADRDNETLPIKSVLIFKPLYTNGLITKIVAYDEYDWINTVMAARSYKCNETVVERPKTEEKVASAAPKPN